MMAYKISLVNPKGGAGKSTVAIHIARCLQLSGDSAVLLDLEATDMSLPTTWFKRTELEVFTVEPVKTMKQVRTRISFHQQRDYVILDSAAGQSEMAIAAAYVSDLVIIPTFPDLQTLEPAMKTYYDLKAIQENAERPSEIRMLICRAERNTRLLQMTIDALKGECPLFDTILYKYQLYPWSITNGSTVFDEDLESSASKQLAHLVEEIRGIQP